MAKLEQTSFLDDKVKLGSMAKREPTFVLEGRVRLAPMVKLEQTFFLGDRVKPGLMAKREPTFVLEGRVRLAPTVKLEQTLSPDGRGKLGLMARLEQTNFDAQLPKIPRLFAEDWCGPTNRSLIAETPVTLIFRSQPKLDSLFAEDFFV